MRLSPVPFAKSPFEVNDLFARQRMVDPPGRALHVFLGGGACFLAGWPTSFVEWAPLPLLICFLIRMTSHHRVLRPVWFDPCVLLTAAWALWLALSISWSEAGAGSSRQWLNDVQGLRYSPFVLALWPVLDRRGLLVWCLVAGIACGQITQLGQLLQQALHLDLFPIHRMPGRTSGWWDPVVGGSILCGALGLHLAGVVVPTSPRMRLFAAAGSALTLLSILATGTRGAWIGAAILVVAALLIGWWRNRSAGWQEQQTVRGATSAQSRGRAVRPLLGVLCILLVLGAFFTPPVHSRFVRGVSEVRAALTSENYASDTGLRIAMWRWAGAAWRTHPIRGVGAGGYQPWVRSRTAQEAERLCAPASAAARVHAHAHSWYLHTLATTGIVGALMLFPLTAIAIWSGVRGPRMFWPSAGYALGPALALIGLCAAGLFDSITVNAQTSYLFWILVALCLPIRPRALDEGARA